MARTGVTSAKDMDGNDIHVGDLAELAVLVNPNNSEKCCVPVGSIGEIIDLTISDSTYNLTMRWPARSEWRMHTCQIRLDKSLVITSSEDEDLKVFLSSLTSSDEFLITESSVYKLTKLDIRKREELYPKLISNMTDQFKKMRSKFLSKETVLNDKIKNLVEMPMLRVSGLALVNIARQDGCVIYIFPYTYEPKLLIKNQVTKALAQEDQEKLFKKCKLGIYVSEKEKKYAVYYLLDDKYNIVDHYHRACAGTVDVSAVLKDVSDVIVLKDKLVEALKTINGDSLAVTEPSHMPKFTDLLARSVVIPRESTGAWDRMSGSPFDIGKLVMVSSLPERDNSISNKCPPGILGTIGKIVGIFPDHNLIGVSFLFRNDYFCNINDENNCLYLEPRFLTLAPEGRERSRKLCASPEESLKSLAGTVPLATPTEWRV